MRLKYLALSIALAIPSQAAAQGTWEERRVERLAWPEFDTFENDREYRAWLRDVDRIRRSLRNRRASVPQNQSSALAALRRTHSDCPLIFDECQPDAERDAGQRIVVTGSRVASNPMSITNNQSAGVDEGDFVKRIGDYLLVLQDGRIFAADFRSMALTDRIDVYRADEDGEPLGADWYDEMLVQGDYILITAYSYNDEATELSVFKLDQETGQIERRGVFLISSEDYYDVDNYATRVVGDQLVIYTPYDAEDLADRRGRPTIRRFVTDDEFDNADRHPILNARDIYRPVFGTFDPVVHTLTVCDLEALSDDELGCESTAFIAGEAAEMYVSPENIYLATSAANQRDYSRWRVCRSVERGATAPGPAPGAIFRVPLNGNSPSMLPVRGLPFDQFSLDEFDGSFRALLHSQNLDCELNLGNGRATEPTLELVDVGFGSFRDTYREASDRMFDPLPPIGIWNYENRFIGDWLLYGNRTRYGRPPEVEDDEELSPNSAIAVRLDDPGNPQQLTLGHEVTRIESLGQDAVITGYRDQTGLYVSLVDLAGEVLIADQTLLDGHFESESRSHAFNAMTYPQGSGIMGLPTVREEDDANRDPWRTDDSGISFLSFDSVGQMHQLGWLEAKEPTDKRDNSYSCEVSCIDWYGNARPIFIDRSVFALMGTELVEGNVTDDTITASRRLDLTAEPSVDSGQ